MKCEHEHYLELVASQPKHGLLFFKCSLWRACCNPSQSKISNTCEDKNFKI